VTPYCGVPGPVARVAKRLLAIVFVAASAGAFAATPISDPRARAVATARDLAVTVRDSLAAPVPGLLIRVIAGDAGQARLATATAHLLTAFAAGDVADAEWERAARLARRRGDAAGYGMALIQRADIALAQGDYARCLELAERLQSLARRTGNPEWDAAAERNFGVVARRRGRLDSAMAHQQRSLDLYRADGNPVRAAQALSDLATVHRDRGDLGKALDSALESLAIREKAGVKVEIAYRNIALLYREIEDTEEARRYFRRAMDAAGTVNPVAYVTVLGPFSTLLNDVGDHRAAQAAAEEALAIDTVLGDRANQGFEHLEIGRALLGLRALDEAASELETALSFGRELGHREITARALLHLAEVSLRRRDHAEARGRLDEAIASLESARLMPQLAHAYDLREQLARAESDYPTALRFAHKHATERENLLGLRAGRQLAMLEARAQREQAEQRITLLAKDNQLKAAQIEKQKLLRHLYLISLAALAVLLLLVVWRFLSAIRHNRVLATTNAEIERQRIALDAANRLLERRALDLQHAAITDSMTGAANRGHAFDRLQRMIEDSRSSGSDLACLLVDFDHFKQINDAHGHLFGDDVLVTGVVAMRECLEPDDLIGRIGGEEFVIALAGRSGAEADTLAERLRERVSATLSAQWPPLRGMATVSIGIATLGALSQEPSVKALLEAADAALYAAKRGGRNRVRRLA